MSDAPAPQATPAATPLATPPAAPTPEERALWQKRLAAQANNRAWELAEADRRTPGEDEEMLQAAHAAAFFWRIVGASGNRAHAALLLAHVYALLRLGAPARHHLQQCRAFFFDQPCAPWELAIAHAVAANVALAGGDATAHAMHHQTAARLTAALDDAEDRAVIDKTLRRVPPPTGG